MLYQLRGSAKLFQDKRYKRPANQADPDKPPPLSEAWWEDWGISTDYVSSDPNLKQPRKHLLTSLLKRRAQSVTTATVFVSDSI